jgi:hypothetical protein
MKGLKAVRVSFITPFSYRWLLLLILYWDFAKDKFFASAHNLLDVTDASCLPIGLYYPYPAKKQFEFFPQFSKWCKQLFLLIFANIWLNKTNLHQLMNSIGKVSAWAQVLLPFSHIFDHHPML